MGKEVIPKIELIPIILETKVEMENPFGETVRGISFVKRHLKVRRILVSHQGPSCPEKLILERFKVAMAVNFY